jgi:hypothetical protein
MASLARTRLFAEPLELQEDFELGVEQIDVEGLGERSAIRIRGM